MHALVCGEESPSLTIMHVFENAAWSHPLDKIRLLYKYGKETLSRDVPVVAKLNIYR